MFTGIIEAQGNILSVESRQGDKRFTVGCEKLDMSDVKLGDSIAVNGVCLTAVDFSDAYFVADVSNETIQLSTLKHFSTGQRVNLEKALQLSSRLGGHLVSGHVDGVGIVRSIQSDGRSYRIKIEAPESLTRYIAKKGSICIDGTSLTVNDMTGPCFELNIVPHTWENTVFVEYREGSQVNLEVDVIARYLEKLMHSKNQDGEPSNITSSFLAQHGFL